MSPATLSFNSSDFGVTVGSGTPTAAGKCRGYAGKEAGQDVTAQAAAISGTMLGTDSHNR